MGYIERITYRNPLPPTNYSVDVLARWLALRALYLATRNRERARG